MTASPAKDGLDAEHVGVGWRRSSHPIPVAQNVQAAPQGGKATPLFSATSTRIPGHQLVYTGGIVVCQIRPTSVVVVPSLDARKIDEDDGLIHG